MSLSLFFAALSLSLLFGQSKKGAATNTYTSPDGVFEFQYPANLALCHKDARQEDFWEPGQWCNAWIPTCSDGGRNRSGVVACFGFKSGAAEKGTIYGGAAFTAVDLGQSKDERSCLQRSPVQASSGKWRLEKINGVEFHVTDSAGGMGGHWADGHVYRTVHDGRCYELNTLITGLNGQITDTPTPDFNEARVKTALQVPLSTFKFVK